jgi:hypothetical protein
LACQRGRRGVLIWRRPLPRLFDFDPYWLLRRRDGGHARRPRVLARYQKRSHFHARRCAVYRFCEVEPPGLGRGRNSEERQRQRLVACHSQGEGRGLRPGWLLRVDGRSWAQRAHCRYRPYSRRQRVLAGRWRRQGIRVRRRQVNVFLRAKRCSQTSRDRCRCSTGHRDRWGRRFRPCR